MGKPILLVDFDGVIHSYASGWQGPDVANDPPVPGAMAFLEEATKHFVVAIYSSRSSQPGGVECMRDYIKRAAFVDPEMWSDWVGLLQFPLDKPPAFLTIDDRALTFEGTWPSIEKLKSFKPWNKRSEVARAR
jgi:hypothetical protein